jgi:hypothetical protein
MRYNSRLDTTHNGLPHPFRDAGVISDKLTGVAMKLLTQGHLGAPTGEAAEDLYLESVEVTQWVHLYLSISYDRCCLEQWSATWGTRRHLTSITTKHRNRLNIEPALILTLTKIRPRTEVLACQKQAQSS